MTPKHKSIRHKSIKLLPHERALLVKMYLERRIPIEQYAKRPGEIDRLVEDWRKLTGRADKGGELVHYMRTQRKRGLWVTFDGEHMKAPKSAAFSAEDTEILVAIYTEDVAAMGVGADALGYEDELKALVAKEFATRTGRYVSGDEIDAKITDLRKRGLLPQTAHVPKAEDDADIGFSDINKIKNAE